MKQQAEILQQEKETALKMAARAFAHGFLKDLVPTVFGLLSDHGYFYDPVERGRLIRSVAHLFCFLFAIELCTCAV